MLDKQASLSQMSSSYILAEHFQRMLTGREHPLWICVALLHALRPRNNGGTKEKLPLALALTCCEWAYPPCLPSWTFWNWEQRKSFLPKDVCARFFLLLVTEMEKNTNTNARVKIKGNLGKGNAGCIVTDRTVTVIIIVFFAVISISWQDRRIQGCLC